MEEGNVIGELGVSRLAVLCRMGMWRAVHALLVALILLLMSKFNHCSLAFAKAVTLVNCNRKFGGRQMNWEQVKGHWKLLKGSVKRKWRDLTNDEINIVEGRRENLIGRLQAKYGYTKEEAEQEADAWARGL